MSVISELRMSAGRLISMSPLYEPFGAHPGEIRGRIRLKWRAVRRSQPSSSHRRGEVTASSDATSIRPVSRSRMTKSTSSMIGTSLKPRSLVNTSRRTNSAWSPYRQGEHPHTQAHANLDQPRRQRPGIEGEAETAMADTRVAVRALDDTPPLARQPRVGVQKQQPVAVRDRGAGIHLPRAAARGGDPDKIRARCPKARQRQVPVRARDHHFGVTEGGGVQCLREHTSVAVRRESPP